MIAEDKFREWGGESLHIQRHEPTGSYIVVAIHSTARGPAAGGLRMRHYDTLDLAIDDVFKLSRAMTFKFATAGMSWGGGKSVINIPNELSCHERQELLLEFGEVVKKLGGKYYAGPDVGTTTQDMDLLYEQGVPYVFSRSKNTGGAGSSAVPTAYGVFCAIQTLCQRLFDTSDLKGRTVLVQGTGKVGGQLMHSLREAGAQVLFNEKDDALVQNFRDQGFQMVSESSVFSTPCDIFSPCAMGGVLNDLTIPVLKCKGIAGAANNQLEHPDHAELLQKHHILYAPDYIVNLGGAIGITAIEGEGMSLTESLKLVRTAISGTLELVFDSCSQNESVLDTANKIVMEKPLKAKTISYD